MRNSPEDQEERRDDAPAEPPADLLRRALSHVEDLLGRLEYPAVKQDELPDLTDDQDGLDIFAEEESAEIMPPAADPQPAPAATGSDVAATVAPSDLAQRIEDQARATADAILDQARRDAASIRAEGRAEAEDLVREAAVEAERTLATAEAQARHRLAVAAATADDHGPGRTDQPVDADAARALDDARAAAADRAEAREILDNARFALTGIRSEVQALREALLFSVGSIESAERAIDALLETPAAGTVPPPSRDGPQAATESAVTR